MDALSEITGHFKNEKVAAEVAEKVKALGSGGILAKPAAFFEIFQDGVKAEKEAEIAAMTISDMQKRIVELENRCASMESKMAFTDNNILLPVMRHFHSHKHQEKIAEEVFKSLSKVGEKDAASAVETSATDPTVAADPTAGCSC